MKSYYTMKNATLRISFSVVLGVIVSLGAIGSEAAMQPIESLSLVQSGAILATYQSDLVWLYLLPVAALLFFIGAMWMRRADQGELAPADYGSQSLGASHELMASLPQERSRTKLSGRSQRSGDKVPLAVAPQTSAQSHTAQPLMTQPIELKPKECTQCRHVFHTTLHACPYDGSKLRAVNTNTEPESSAKAPVSPSSSRRMCSGCQRRFVSDAQYCPYDGLPLFRDSYEQSQNAPTIRICRSCGYEAASDEETTCPNDDTTLAVIDPADTGYVPPTIPLLTCHKCHRYAPPGTAYCVHDGEVLSPVLNARLRALPATGFGPCRKVCEKCGKKYSGRLEFCANDGTKLKLFS